MNKNRLYLFLVLIFSSLVLFAWDVAANRNFIKLMLPQTQRSSSIVASNGESNSDTKPGGITKDCLLPSFVALPNMGVDTAPSSSVVADFNNDGKLDVITANSIANNISRLFGNDIGNLTSQIQIPVGLQPTALAALDFNQDGNQDLVVANRLSQTVTLLLGDGTGNFNSRNNIFLGSLEPISIRVGDFNNDGRLDIASANTNNSISVLTNVDGESLNPTIVLNTGQLPNSLEVADLDHDGNLDIVIGKSDSEELTIFVGDGTGSFTSKNILAGCGVAPKINGVGDFNHDGLIDLLVNGNTNRVLFGDNNGQFNKAIDIVKGSISTFGDFNNDSNLDVLVFVGDKNFSLVLSDGKGRAKTTTNFSIDVDL
ncbi:MAG: Na-Ca exchanger/integrin-beta4, partial [bacterium]